MGVADRAPIDFGRWRYLGMLYEALPTVPPGGRRGRDVNRARG
jgi:hypothetical protein